MKKDGKVHRGHTANKDLFHPGKKSKGHGKSKGWFFGKSGEKKYLLESSIVVHSKK
jgi:hypothetical protein